MTRGRKLLRILGCFAGIVCVQLLSIQLLWAQDLTLDAARTMKDGGALLSSRDFPFQVRKEIASQLYEVLSLVENELPTLSPSQREWLNNEGTFAFEDLDNEARVSKFFNSIEFALLAKDTIVRLTAVLKLLSLGIEDPKSEAGFWCAVSLNLDNDRTVVNLFDKLKSLTEKGFLKEETFERVKRLNVLAYDSLILEKFVLPYFSLDPIWYK